MDARGYDPMDGGGRATLGAKAENNAGAIVEGMAFPCQGLQRSIGLLAELP